MDYEKAFAQARKRVDAKLGFYRHSAVYVAGSGGLALVDVFTSPGVIWFHWPVLGWGLVLAVHGAAVTRRPRTGREKDGGTNGSRT
ncbi:MAG: 2TM domain-containing protein [Desulfatibacillaceae bacterium]